MSKTPLNITRDQLRDMTPNQRSLKAIEQLIRQVNEILPDEFQSLQLDALLANSNSRQALSKILRLADELEIESGVANAKADKALSELRRIADALELLASSPKVNKNNQISTDYIDVSNTVSLPPHKEGRLFYDAADYALSYYNEDSDVSVTLGREQLVRCYNNTGSTILNGELVYVNGANSGYPTVVKAQANTSTASQSTIGMVTADMPNGTFGYVCTSGTVHGLDTSAYTAGTRLYLSGTTAGAWTNVMPLQPNYTVEIGIVVASSATLGKVYIHIDKIDWFPSLEIIDSSASIVLPTTPTIFTGAVVSYNDGFSYNSSTGVLTTLQSAAYSVTIQFNAEPSAANKNIYFYSEEDTGAGWQIKKFSARQLELTNGTQAQLVIPASRYFPVGSKIRFYIWGDATVTLKTTDLPGTTPGTVTKPAFRFSMAG